MTTLLIAIGSFFGFLIAYHTYGRWLARSIFNVDAEAAVPSVALNDDRDYVPTARTVVFGHHFTSIAGTGPIVGPALAIMWGWVPALLWVLLGSVFIGAVHDFGSLIVSMRNRGQTVGDIAGRVLNPRVRFLFLAILLFGLWIVLAIFGLVIASVFKTFPESILPVFLQIPIAVGIGYYLHRKGVGLLLPSAIALTLMYATVWLGAGCPGMEWTGGALGEGIRGLNSWLNAWPLWLWTAVLLVYCYLASVLPVWILLQPRDYINSLQLLANLALIVLGLGAAAMFGVAVDAAKVVITDDGKGLGEAEMFGVAERQRLEMVAPMVNWNPTNAPPLMPLLFITIACGAISGFHCLVSSGTSSKQLKNETDAQFVGYGSMLTEAFLAVLVILAVGAGIGLGWPNHATYGALQGSELWHAVYADWKAAGGLQNTIGAFVVGTANFLQALGLNHAMATAIVGVLVASFAGTTMDTATRLQRYVIQELATALAQQTPALQPIARPLQNAHVASLTAVTAAFALAMLPAPGKPWTWDTMGSGGQILWPLFGATNQLLGGLAFLVIAFWLWRRNKPVWFIVLPTIFMLIMPAWAMLISLRGWWNDQNYLLVGIAVVALALEAWMIVEAILVWPRARGVLEEALAPLPSVASPPAQEAVLAGQEG